METWVGTSGFSYKQWKGPFYPEDLADKEMLSYYSSQLAAVELDNTFYRMPKRNVLESWVEQTPDDFRFTLKASRRITHHARLKDAEDPMGFLMKNVRSLGEKLGCVLFQLPPYSKKDLARLEGFLPLIPEDIPAAFEFRHDSWFEEDVFDCLRGRNIALCLADTEKAPSVELISTADWGYLRLRKEDYSTDELRQWASKIAEMDWEETFAFFKHEDEGAAPIQAEEMVGILGEVLG